LLSSTIAFTILIPAILGAGNLGHLLYRKTFAANHRGNLLENAILGLSIISAVANWLNFFTAISIFVQAGILLIGWAGFAHLLRQKEFLKPKPILIISAIAWAFVLIFLRANIPPDYYDTGYYGLQNLYWYQQSPLPLGLANLHARFAYNSSWLALSSIVHSPNIDYFISGEILLWFIGFMTFYAIQDSLNKSLNIVRIYGLLIPLVLLTPVLGTFTLSALATDLPIFWLSITLGWISLRAISNEIPSSYAAWFTFVLACFAVTVKLSALPVFLIFFSLLVIQRKDAKKHFSRLVKAALPIALFILLPWLARFFWMSGCLIYPVSFTCSKSAQWGITSQAAQWMADYIKQFAILRTLTPTEIQSPWFFDQDLLQKWFDLYFGYPETFTALFFLGLALGVYLASLKNKSQNRNSWHEIGLILPYAGAIIFWFFTAPDVRFVSGYIWTLALLFFSFGIFYLLNQQEARIQNLAYVFIFAMLVGLTSISFIRIVSNNFRLPLSINWVWPVPEPRAATFQENIDGVSVRYPQKSDLLCWGEPLPCTPELHPDLRIIKENNGQIKMFYIKSDE
jgi:hypothetical protein